MTLSNIKGRVAYIFDEIDFDVDQIVGVKNIKIKDVEQLASVAMQSYDPDFSNQVRPNDILIGNDNFGYGHPHYPPMIAMRKLGIAGVIAESFSPGYWRGEIAMGFPQVTCPGILKLVNRWDEVEIDWQTCRVLNHATNEELNFEPLSVADRQMLEAGGLIGYLHERDKADKKREQST